MGGNSLLHQRNDQRIKPIKMKLDTRKNNFRDILLSYVLLKYVKLVYLMFW